MSKTLLTKSLVFQNNEQIVNVYQLNEEQFFLQQIKEGKIGQINMKIQDLQYEKKWNEVVNLVNIKDKEDKDRNGLFYCSYYGYKNLLLYLLNKGTEWMCVDNFNQNIFHVALFHGRLECVAVAIHFLLNQQRIQLYDKYSQLMKKHSFKKSDFKDGKFVNTNKDIQSVQNDIYQLQQELIQELVQHCNTLSHIFETLFNQLDNDNRNPFHYASFNKFINCYETIQFLCQFQLQMPYFNEFYHLHQELQGIEMNDTHHVDIRQYLSIYQMIKIKISEEKFRQIIGQFNKKVRSIVKRIINEQDLDGYTSMHLAAFNGDFKLIQYLDKMGGDKNIKSRVEKKEVIHFASNQFVRKHLGNINSTVVNNDEAALKILVETGQDINQKNSIFGQAAIHSAVRDKVTILKSIINYNAEVDLCDANGWTALHHAAHTGNQEACTILLDSQSDLFITTKKLYSPLHLAALSNHPHIIHLFFQHLQHNHQLQSKLINLKSYQGLNSVHLSAKKGNYQALQMLITLKANIYELDDFKQSALYHATYNNHPKIISLLLINDCDEEKLRKIKNNQGKLPKDIITNMKVREAFNNIWFCSANGEIDHVRKLIQLNVDINGKTKEKENTALILATINNQVLIVKYLLENKADPNIRNKEGKRAKDYAYQNNNIALVQLLDQDLV